MAALACVDLRMVRVMCMACVFVVKRTTLLSPFRMVLWKCLRLMVSGLGPVKVQWATPFLSIFWKSLSTG